MIKSLLFLIMLYLLYTNIGILILNVEIIISISLIIFLLLVILFISDIITGYLYNKISNIYFIFYYIIKLDILLIVTYKNYIKDIYNKSNMILKIQDKNAIIIETLYNSFNELLIKKCNTIIFDVLLSFKLLDIVDSKDSMYESLDNIIMSEMHSLWTYNTILSSYNIEDIVESY